MNRLTLLLILMVIAFPQESTAKFKGYEYQFSDVYAKPTWKRALDFAMRPEVFIPISAIATIGITYVTAGTGTVAAAGAISKFIGTMLGSALGYSGIAATNAGLAMLGGGSLASGGFGVLGGIAVLNGIGDIGLGTIMHLAPNPIPSNETQESFNRTLRLPTNVGTEENRDAVAVINNLIETSADEFFQQANSKEVDRILNILASRKVRLKGEKDFDEYRFDVLTSAIADFNLGNFSEAHRKLYGLEISANKEKDGFLTYFRSFLCLVEGDRMNAYHNLRDSIKSDPEAIPPYLLLALMYREDKNISQAIDVLLGAREEVGERVFSINYFLASLYFENNNYDSALDMYKEALKNITLNNYESECKIYIAVCYAKSGNVKEANAWRKEAFDELGDEYSQMREYINSIYENNVQ